MRWGIAIFLLVIVALFFWGQRAPLKSDHLSVALEENGVLTITWDGPIDPPMANLFSQTYDRYKDNTTYIKIDLHSPGGSVSEGDQVIQVIRKMKRHHKVHTYVGEDKKCLSMCVPIYLQGHQRTADASSLWMFHQPFTVDALTGEKTFVYYGDQQLSAEQVFHKYFRRSEINQEWAEALKKQLVHGEVWKTGRELRRENSNIVLKIE